jgi:hypothetical protein
MKQVIVRYRVRPERAAENEELVRAVYAELQERKPAALHYATFRLDDGVSFLHLSAHDTDGPNPLTKVEAFKRFQEKIADRCDEAPVVSSLTEIGSYAVFRD